MQDKWEVDQYLIANTDYVTAMLVLLKKGIRIFREEQAPG
jgi:hypothetical protein